jgi:hypothetical protein
MGLVQMLAGPYLLLKMVFRFGHILQVYSLFSHADGAVVVVDDCNNINGPSYSWYGYLIDTWA